MTWPSTPPSSPWQPGHPEQPYLVMPPPLMPPPLMPRAAPTHNRRTWLIAVLAAAIVVAAAAFTGADVYLANERGNGIHGPAATSLSIPLQAAPLSDRDIHFKLPDTVDGLPLVHDATTQHMLETLAKSLSYRQIVIDTPVAAVYQADTHVAILAGLPTIAQDPRSTLDQLFRTLGTSGIYRVASTRSYPSPSTGGSMECADVSLVGNSAFVFGTCVNYDDSGIEILLRARQTAATTATLLGGLLPAFEIG